MLDTILRWIAVVCWLGWPALGLLMGIKYSRAGKPIEVALFNVMCIVVPLALADMFLFLYTKGLMYATP